MSRSLLEASVELADEWHPNLNGQLTPESASVGSGKKYWWLGKCGHVWDSTINSRMIASGCPVCSGRRVQIGINDLETTHPELASEWHPDKNGALRPTDVSRTYGKNIWWLGKCGHTWENNVAQRLRVPPCPVCSGHRVQAGFNDLLTTEPEISLEWHPSLNFILKPTEVSRGSRQVVWWLGKCGHAWDAKISDKVRNPGCPVCSGHRVQAGFNDLVTTHPQLAEEWDFDANANRSPKTLSAGSNSKVWWKANCGHKWEAAIYSRVSGHGCPYCAGNRLHEGVNDLSTNFPSLLLEWHPTKNGDLQPSKVSSHSPKLIWWLCRNGHEWKSSASNRAAGKGCGKCSGHFVSEGENDLATLRPDLAVEWSSSNKRLPSTVRPGSDYVALWNCPIGHEYKAAVKHRSGIGTGCPYCARKKVLRGFNDLATTHPDVASTWDFSKNGASVPTTIIAGSHKRVFWLCKEGHSFSQFVYRQALEKTGCPFCGFRKLLPGFNDLLSQDPIVAGEWDFEKNPLKPYQVLYGGHTKYWFKCASGHKWKADLITRKRSGCPGCAKYGFKGTEPAYLYLLRNLRLKAIKIGITNKKTSRISDFQRSGWELLATKEFKIGHEARELETVLKKILNLNISREGFVERSEMGRLGGFTETAEWSAKLEKKLIVLVGK